MYRFFIYGSLGWCLEVIWTGLASFLSGDLRLSSNTYLWMFPIYGLALVFEPIHDSIRTWHPVVRGFLWMLLFFGVEYLTGWLIRSITGECPWDYSYSPWQVDGLIRLDFIPVWFCVGLLYEKVHDFLMRIKVDLS